MENEIEVLEISVRNLISFFIDLRSFLLELEALNNKKVNNLFVKYKVSVAQTYLRETEGK